MSLPADAVELIDSPDRALSGLSRRRLGAAGWTGFFVGTLSFFVFLRLFGVVPGGALSFLAIFLLLRASNFVSASAVHLALETAAAEGSALRLFLAFGLAEAFWAAGIPLAFFSKAGYLSPVLAFVLTLGLVFYARVRLVKVLYLAGSRKAVLSLLAPFYLLGTLAFLGLAWTLVWLVWLVS